MRLSFATIASLFTATSLTAMAAASPAAAQTVSAAAAAPFSVPAMPLTDALQQIAQRTGTSITADPDAVRGVRSAPVRNARSATAAVRDALRDTKLAVMPNDAGGLMVVNDIVVVAHRDEAETGVLVRQASTSDRTGQSLREQPRNTQVISAKLIDDQQSLSVLDALRNVAGVSVNTATVQGGASYSVRGFASNGLTNGLQGSSATGVPAGATQPVAALERIEVLKGPDAVLAGADNLGGAVNLVYRKPSADPILELQAETGSFGLRRFVLDANEALTADQHLSARVIASASDSDHNFGGYRGDSDSLFLPEIRFKNATTDILVGFAKTDTIAGNTPFTFLNPATNQPYDFQRNQPLFSRDQYIRVGNDQVFVTATQKVTDWLELNTRFQHQHTELTLNLYTLYAVLDPSGLALLSNAQSRQYGDSDAVDAFAKLKFRTAGIRHTLVAGFNYLDGSTDSYAANNGGMFLYQFLGSTAAPDPIAQTDTLSYLSGSTQKGYYVQDLLEFWKLHLIGSVRRTTYDSYGILYFRRGQHTSDHQAATTPSFGAVFDVTRNISLFGNYFRGFSPTFTRAFDGSQLPDIKTRNVEGGVKIDLFAKRLAITASYFDLRQSNILIADPRHNGFSTAAPGQEGRGVDLSVSGTILRDWTVQASFTDTDYSYLVDTGYGNVVQAQPKVQYSLYSAYERAVGDGVRAGVSAGIYGRSSAAIDQMGTAYVPESRQVDVNAMLKLHGFSINAGIRNLFDRKNYGVTYNGTYIPYLEPRSWRLTIGYKFL